MAGRLPASTIAGTTHSAPDEMIPETIAISAARVARDGGGGGLGHPRVFLTIDEAGSVTCPYCSRRYVIKAAADAAAG